jgi:hypothetical protein
VKRKHKFQVGDKVLAEGKEAVVKERLWTMKGTPVYITSAWKWVVYERNVRLQS